MRVYFDLLFFFFNDTATTEIYTLSLHDALPIFEPIRRCSKNIRRRDATTGHEPFRHRRRYWAAYARAQYSCQADRKSTRLNSSHGYISYAVFCLKKKKK